ncbi:hypothetical protein HZT01_09535 [Klebsiella pneumoniae]|nr:hypothetical protein HZT01_09535 [Klebsiella pneumoniae]
MHTGTKKRFRLFHVLRVQDSLGFYESRVTLHTCEDFRRSGSIPDSGIPGFEGIGFAVTPCPHGINRPDLLELIRVYFLRFRFIAFVLVLIFRGCGGAMPRTIFLLILFLLLILFPG